MPSVFVFGWCHHADLNYGSQQTKADLRIFSGHTINGYPPRSEALYQALSNASRCDLVIFNGLGVSLEKHLQPVLDDSISRDIFNMIQTKVYWSFDTHRQWAAERQYAPLFDAFYAAHSTYLPLLHGIEPAKTSAITHVQHLPQCFWAAPYDELLTRLRERRAAYAKNRETYQQHGVFFAHNPHSAEREILAKIVAIQVEQLGEVIFMAHSLSRLDYLTHLAKSRVCLNIADACTFNARPFEAWALDVPLLAPRSGHYGDLGDLSSAGYFFHRDLSDFRVVCRRALKAAASGNLPKTSESVRQRHLLMHRYLHVINQFFKTNFELDYPAA